MLKDIANKKSVAKVIEDGKTITNFIYNSGWVLDLMRKFTGDRELIRPAITRFATNFIAIESIVRYKQQLRAMFNSDEWKNSRWGKAKTGQPYNVKKITLGKEFWQKATELCKVHEPLVRVLRLVDGDEKPTMGFIYEAIDRAKLAIKRDCRYYTDYWKIIDTRWSFQLHQDLHAAEQKGALLFRESPSSLILQFQTEQTAIERGCSIACNPRCKSLSNLQAHSTDEVDIDEQIEDAIKRSFQIVTVRSFEEALRDLRFAPKIQIVAIDRLRGIRTRNSNNFRSL
ncbi:hypothetical protein ACSBR1_034161 [Camellia fascicularis]